MTVRGIAEAKAKILALAAQFGGAWTMQLTLPPDDMQHLTWLNDGTRRQPARPVLTLEGRVIEAAKAAIVERATADLRASGRINMLVAVNAGAHAAKRVYVERLSLSGADVRLAPLSPRYAWRKHRKGLDPRIGVARGNLLRAVIAARVTVHKTR